MISNTLEKEALWRVTRKECFIAGLSIIFIGSVVLLGWTLNINVLKSGLPWLAPMNPVTAVTFILAGLSLCLVARTALLPESFRFANRTGQVLALIVVITGLSVLFSHYTRWDLGVDQWLFPDQLPLPGNPRANRMAAVTAFNFTCCGMALFLLARFRVRYYLFAQLLLFNVSLVSLLAFIGYCYQITPPRGIEPFLQMALNTTLLFLLLSLACLWLHPDRGLLGVLLSKHVGGMVGRYLLPVTILIPILLGWFFLEVYWNYQRNIELGIGLLVVLLITVFSILLYLAAKSLNEIDRERRLAEEQLQLQNLELKRINTDLDNFVYTASHDLRSPITNLDGLHRVLSRRLQGKLEATEQELMGHMTTSIVKLNQTIKDLTEIVKVQKEMDQPREPVQLAALTNEILEDISAQVQEAEARIRTRFEVEKLFFIRKHVRSILYNLISNAVKYRDPDRPLQVEITTRRDDSQVILMVTDNGLGIEAELLPKVFMMFKRLHTHVEGSGIGLFMVKRIVENYGGRITVESWKGKGTTFTVYFPDSAY